MFSATVVFPAGAACAAEISVSTLSAATNAAAFAVQEGDDIGVKAICDHIGIQPENYGDAIRQMSTKWSSDPRFAKSYEFASAIRPTCEMIEEVIENVSTIGMEDRRLPSVEMRAGSYLTEIDDLLEALGEAEGKESQEIKREIADSLDHAAEVSLEAGDIEAALAVLEKSWKLLNLGNVSFDFRAHARMAEYWTKLGNVGRASGHMDIVRLGLGDRSVEVSADGIQIVSAIAYARMGSPVRAISAASGIRDREGKFSTYLTVAHEMATLRLFGRAEGYVSEYCLPMARKTGDDSVRIGRFRRVVDMFMKHSMRDSAKVVMDELIAPHVSVDSQGIRDTAYIKWAEEMMKRLGYPPAGIATMIPIPPGDNR